MPQEQVWEKEYQNGLLVTKDDKPQSDTLDFFRFLKREKKFELFASTILDLGCGTGRNSNYLGLEGAKVTGVEISSTALKLATQRRDALAAQGNKLSVDYIKGDIGAVLPFENDFFDVVIDVTSSNSLDESGRARYLHETHRVLKSGGYFFVKTLCKDGDHNAKNLLKLSPGKEHDTYLMPELGLTERVWSKEDFVAYYSSHFNIEKMDKKTNYSTFNDRIYKRNFWLVYMTKK